MEERITFTIETRAPTASNRAIAQRQRKALQEAVQTWQAVLGFMAPDDLEALTAYVQ